MSITSAPKPQTFTVSNQACLWLGLFATYSSAARSSPATIKAHSPSKSVEMHSETSLKKSVPTVFPYVHNPPPPILERAAMPKTIADHMRETPRVQIHNAFHAVAGIHAAPARDGRVAAKNDPLPPQAGPDGGPVCVLQGRSGTDGRGDGVVVQGT